MPKDQIVLGSMISGLSLLGLACEGWLLDNTNKGRTLRRWFGDVGGRWALRGVLATLATFGVLLALDIVHPMRWK